MAVILLACICLTAAGAKVFAEQEHWPRYSLLGVPVLEAAPEIDGRVGQREWAGAVATDRVVQDDTGIALNQSVQVRLGHTDTTLYIAFEIERPETARAPGEDDVFELELDPGLTRERVIAVTVNHLGIVRTLTREAGGDESPHSLDIEYAARRTDVGWEGEMAITFDALDVAAPSASERWGVNWAIHETTPGVRTGRLSYPGDFPPSIHKYGQLLFTGRQVAVQMRSGWLRRHRDAGVVISAVNFEGEDVDLDAHLWLGRAEEALPMSFFPVVDNATTDDVGDARGDLGEEIEAARALYTELQHDTRTLRVPAGQRRMMVVAVDDEPGAYLGEAHVALEGQTLLGVMAPFDAPDHLGLDVALHALSRAIEFEVDLRRLQNALTDDARLEVAVWSAEDQRVDQATYNDLRGREDVYGALREVKLAYGGRYRVAVAVKTEEQTLAERETFVSMPAREELPSWWTLEKGRTPAVPPPWTPVEATVDVQTSTVQVWGRTYDFADGQPVPARIVTRTVEILASPMQLRTGGEWQVNESHLVEHAETHAIHHSELQHEGAILRATTRIEFDGFMLVELELTGEGDLDELELVIPFKREHAILWWRNAIAPGPGSEDPSIPRNGYLPGEAFTMPPRISTWIGTDDYGLELSMESTRGWAMSHPAEAVRISPDGDQTVMTVRMIERPVALGAQPRRIRFGLHATPTKEIMPHVQRAYNQLNYNCQIQSAHDFTGFYHWHPPITDPQRADEWAERIAERQRDGYQWLLNGGWHVSLQDPHNEPWVPEMLRRPARNRSFGPNQQQESCYNTPYAEFMFNSWGHNARLLGMKGIRFDTVTPGRPCNNLAHDCGWYDDDGNLWPSRPIYGQRRIWKHLYRIFHDGEIENGLIWTPQGRIAAIQSFTDLLEVAEGPFTPALTLKDGYETGYARTYMSGSAWGWKTVNSVDGRPGALYANERVASLLLHDADPRFFQSNIRRGYEAHSLPSLSIWSAWEWVDRFQADFRGWWENGDMLEIDTPEGAKILGSFHHNQERNRVLLVVTNYEPQPYAQVPVRLDLSRLGLTGPVYAEDAITMQAVPVSRDGEMHLDILKERYRLIRLSHDPPRYRDEAMSENLVPAVPEEITGAWASDEIVLEPDSEYMISALLRIDEDMPANDSQKFGPRIRSWLELYLDGQGVEDFAFELEGAAKGGIYPDGRRYPERTGYRQLLPLRTQLWERTPGWMPVYLAVRTGEDAGAATVRVRHIGEGEFRLREISLRRLNEVNH